MVGRRVAIDTSAAGGGDGSAHLVAGRLTEAERDARSAVDYFATTDFITFHANSALILGDVLRAAGRPTEADASFQQALDLYQRKGSLVGMRVAAARRRIAARVGRPVARATTSVTCYT